MRVLLLCLLALGVQATYLAEWDDPGVSNAASKDVGRQNGLLKRKHRKLSPNKNKKEITKVNNEIKQGDSRETFFDNLKPEPQEYIPSRGKQKALKSRVKNKRRKTKVNSESKQYDNREEFSGNVKMPEPQEYVPPRDKQKALNAPMKNKRGKTKVNSKIKQYDNREAFSDDVIPEPQEYLPPRGKQKLSKLSAFSTASVAQGIQFMADIVTIASSDFWKWMNEVG